MGYVRGMVVPALLLLTGCSSVFERSVPSVVAEPEARAPIVSDRFLLDDATAVVGELQVIEAQHEDTFVDIARTYNLGFDELVEANPGIDPWLPGEGTRILLPTRFILPDTVREGIVINIANKRLFFYPPPDNAGQRVVVTHPIGIGREGTATPLGTTTVTQKGRDPVWYPTASIRREYAAEGNPLPAQVPPGPDNPLGRYVLVLGMPSYLIHGTNKPAGVGMRVSHGCVRLFPENIEALYEVAPVGVSVTIVNQPYLAAWQDGELLLEAHPPLEDDETDWQAGLPEIIATAAADSGLQDYVDEERIAGVVSAAEGIPLPLLGAGAREQAALVNNLVAHPQLAEAL